MAKGLLSARRHLVPSPETQRHRQTHTNIDIHTNAHRYTHIDTHRYTQTYRNKHTHTEVRVGDREEQSIEHKKVTQLMVQLSGSLLVMSQGEGQEDLRCVTVDNHSLVDPAYCQTVEWAWGLALSNSR